MGGKAILIAMVLIGGFWIMGSLGFSLFDNKPLEHLQRDRNVREVADEEVVVPEKRTPQEWEEVRAKMREKMEDLAAGVSEY